MLTQRWVLGIYQCILMLPKKLSIIILSAENIAPSSEKSYKLDDIHCGNTTACTVLRFLGPSLNNNRSLLYNNEISVQLYLEDMGLCTFDLVENI